MLFLAIMRYSVALAFACLGVATLCPAPALADPPCGAVEFRFQPGAWNLQMVVWIEDAQGNVKATPYITRATGDWNHPDYHPNAKAPAAVTAGA